jgi:peroxiredoxin
VRILPFLIFLLSTGAWAQYSIKGTIDPSHDYSWILLYKLENGDQTYVDNADVVDGAFEFKVDEGASGIYRAYYQIENNLYVEFIYNKEEVDFTFDPENPAESIFFSQSDENSLYQEYYKTVRARQKAIDSVQGLYFATSDPKETTLLETQYKKALTDLETHQKEFEERSQDMMAHHIVRASRQYNPPSPVKEPQVYIDEIKAHFFDSMDVNDSVLAHSSFITDRMRDYVLYLNQSDTQEASNILQKEAIDKAVNWAGDKYVLLEKFEESLIQEYLHMQNTPMVQYVMDEHYMELPKEVQDIQFMRKITASMKTAIGVRAPDFSWEVEGQEKHLYGLMGTDYYIVLFFSSGCPHCQMEVPEFHKFISGIENMKVVTVGLEDEIKSWEDMTANYPEFINVLDLDKWSSPKVKAYGVQAIPSYFVLDSEKRILAKPEDFEELKSLFEQR